MPRSSERREGDKKVQVWMTEAEQDDLDALSAMFSIPTRSGVIRHLVSQQKAINHQLSEFGGGDLTIRGNNGRSAIIILPGFGKCEEGGKKEDGEESSKAKAESS